MKKAIFQVFTFDVASKGMLAVTILLLIRCMQQHDLAAYIWATSAASVLATTVSAAFNRVYIVAGNNATASETGTYVAAQLWCCGLLSLLLLPFAGLSKGLYGYVVLLALGICLSDFAKTFYQRRMQFLQLSLVELLRTMLFLGSTLVLIVAAPARFDASSVLTAQAVTMLVVAAIVFMRYVKWTDLTHVRQAFGLLFRLGLNDYRYLTGYFILVAVLTYLTVLMLEPLRGEHAVAVFGSAFRYYNLLSLALAAVHVVLLPAVQQARDPLEVEEILIHHRRLIPIFACLVAIAAISAQWVIPLIDQGRYPESIAAFRILSVSALISFALSPHINILLSARDFYFIFYLMLVGVAASAAITALLIVGFGTSGAAWGFLLSMGCINFIVYRRALAFRAFRLQTA